MFVEKRKSGGKNEPSTVFGELVESTAQPGSLLTDPCECSMKIGLPTSRKSEDRRSLCPQHGLERLARNSALGQRIFRMIETLYLALEDLEPLGTEAPSIFTF